MRSVTDGYAPLPPLRNHHGILQLRIHLRDAVHGHEEEVNLVNVERVCLAAPVLDGPVLHLAHGGGDRRRVRQGEHLRPWRCG
jgi:hypothetical protein